MYRQFNIQQFYVLSTKCIYVFCVDLRTNSDDFPIQNREVGGERGGREEGVRRGCSESNYIILYYALYYVFTKLLMLQPPRLLTQHTKNIYEISFN